MNPKPFLGKLKLTFLDLLFPLRCIGCGREGSMLCTACAGAIPRLCGPRCEKCGLPVGRTGLCRSCASYSLAIDGIRSPFVFEGTVRRAILALKYRRLKALGSPLGQMLGNDLVTSPMTVDCVVPVPLHAGRLRRRGFNQAELLAAEVGRISGLPVALGLLTRLRDTPAQVVTAGRAERMNNMRGAFASRQTLSGERMLVIDDVCTTGATLDACAVALKEAGAGGVWGLTVARTLIG